MLASSENLQGKRLFQQGDMMQALARFDQAIQHDPESSDAFYNKAATYHHLGTQSGNQQYLTQAEILYNDAIDREPNHTDAYRGLAVLLIQTDRKESAFTLLRRWNAANPLSPDPKLELARLYREYDDDQTAVDLVVEALRQDPSNARANAVMGQLREEQGELDLAYASYQRAHQASGHHPELAARMALLQQRVSSQNATQDANRMVQRSGTIPVPNTSRY